MNENLCRKLGALGAATRLSGHWGDERLLSVIQEWHNANSHDSTTEYCVVIDKRRMNR
jgi:hypothetical protein